jgi:hypothetical protein
MPRRKGPDLREDHFQILKTLSPLRPPYLANPLILGLVVAPRKECEVALPQENLPEV